MPRKKGETTFSQNKYYEQNKEKLLSDRASRYATDPLYKAKVQEAARKRYKEKQESQGVKKVDGTTYVINGTTYVTTGYIAAGVGIAASLVNYYSDSGYLPLPNKKLGYSRKMYPIQLATAIVEVLKEYTQGSFSDGKQIRIRVAEIIGNKVYRSMTQW